MSDEVFPLYDKDDYAPNSGISSKTKTWILNDFLLFRITVDCSKMSSAQLLWRGRLIVDSEESNLEK